MQLTSCSPDGRFSEYIKIIIERQLLDKVLWEKCTDVFGTGADNADAGWRGEYFGKMMRGACLIYKVAPSPELYAMLTYAAKRLLTKQENSGRISTYTADSEFYDWDMWSRKYVMTGLMHYCEICTDKQLKADILTALTAHADYITAHIGSGKTEILDTGSFWGGVNSASILEPFVELYRRTGKADYLDFAKYIISTGGCRDGSLTECALGDIPPYLFPEQKAYETMSFFEGLLAYYEVTGEETALEAVVKFTDNLLKTDVTVIGSCGCTHELFDNSASAQTEHTGKIMQETCVTVTLIRLLARVYKTTGDKRLTDTIRLAALNALSGALNINGFEQYSNEKKEYLPGLTFDSYSPLCDSQRGLGIGGFKVFADGSYFGCCACIASAGFALYPLTAVTANGGTVAVNYLLNGTYGLKDENGADVLLTVGGGKITVNCTADVNFTLKITNGDEYTAVSCAADGKAVCRENGFTVFDGVWKNGDEVLLTVENKLTELNINGKCSFNYGGFALAADTAKTPLYIPGRKIQFNRNADGGIIYELRTPENGEQIRAAVKTADGELILTDYPAAGQNGKSTVTVWF